MFAKKDQIKMLGRLKKRSDFLRVQQKGQKWVSKSMVVEIAPNDNLGLRYGLTVSKKASKLAVTRNRIKRRLRAMAQEVLLAYDNHNIDVVLIGRAATEKKEFDDLKTDLQWCLGKMGVEPHENSTD